MYSNSHCSSSTWIEGSGDWGRRARNIPQCYFDVSLVRFNPDNVEQRVATQCMQRSRTTGAVVNEIKEFFRFHAASRGLIPQPQYIIITITGVPSKYRVFPAQPHGSQLLLLPGNQKVIII